MLVIWAAHAVVQGYIDESIPFATFTTLNEAGWVVIGFIAGAPTPASKVHNDWGGASPTVKNPLGDYDIQKEAILRRSGVERGRRVRVRRDIGGLVERLAGQEALEEWHLDLGRPYWPSLGTYTAFCARLHGRTI